VTNRLKDYADLITQLAHWESSGIEERRCWEPAVPSESCSYSEEPGTIFAAVCSIRGSSMGAENLPENIQAV
jgi:hypothetical protein